jgi:predicted transcriptional regulator
MVWDHGSPVTVRELFGELRHERPIAYTAVMSTMDNLHRKGWLAREKDGNARWPWHGRCRCCCPG